MTERVFDAKAFDMIRRGLDLLPPGDRDPAVLSYGWFQALAEWADEGVNRGGDASRIAIYAARHSNVALENVAGEEEEEVDEENLVAQESIDNALAAVDEAIAAVENLRKSPAR